MLAATPTATPFARWSVHRTWWDAYSSTAHERCLAALESMTGDGAPEAADVRAIVPLMHRQELEPEDGMTATVLRRHSRPVAATPVRPDAKAVFFGAPYHTDYATVLCAPDDLPAVVAALAFDDGWRCFLYNAGMDPDAAELSPGVIGTAAHIRDRLAHGRREFDWLRGDEPYNYEWGARNEAIERLLVMREGVA